MRILIIRHGDPDYSIDSLTEKGWHEAHLLADRLVNEKIDDIYCSTFGRARDTAKETLERKKMTATYCEWLREINYMKVDNPNEPGTEKSMWDFMPRFFCNDELLHQKDAWKNDGLFDNTEITRQYDEICSALDGVLSKHGYKRHGNMYLTECGNHDTIAFFCHFGLGSILLSHLLNVSPFIMLQNTFLAPTSVTEIITEERIKGEASLRAQKIGDISHLYVANEPISFSGRFCECFEDDTRH